MSKDEGGWNSSVSEQPVRSRLRGLVGWINLTGAKKVLSLIDKVFRRKNPEMTWEKVKENRGSGGVDRQSLKASEAQPNQQLDRLQRELREDTPLMTWRACGIQSFGGWIQYYGRFYKSALYPVLRHFDGLLVRWAMRKNRRLATVVEQNIGWAALRGVSQECLPSGICWACVPRPDDGSRMSGDVHARVLQSPGAAIPPATHRVITCKSAAAARAAMETQVLRNKLRGNPLCSFSPRPPKVRKIRSFRKDDF